MKKNVASQVIGVQMVNAADGTAFTGTATVVITKDGGTQSASGGTGPTHEGNGLHTYIPTQAETNADHIAFTHTGSGAIPATVQVYTGFPQSQDNAPFAPGAFAVTVNVKDDGASNLENATVRLIEGINNYVSTTDASGNASFTLDAATYSVTLFKNGYQDDANSDLVISGAGTENVTMTDVAIPAAPADASLCSVYGYVEQLDTSAAAGVSITLTLITPSAIKSNKIIKKEVITLLTDGSGNIIIQNLQRNDLMTPKTSFYQVDCAEIGWSGVRLILNAATKDLADLIT
jgi:hypothetical protein